MTLPDSQISPKDFDDSKAWERLPAELIRQDGQLLQLVDAALGDASERAGRHLVCRPGCTQCCHGAFAIDALDALRLRTAMQLMRMTDTQRALRIEDRAGHYIQEFAAEFPGDAVTGVLGRSEAEEAAFEDFANDAACPALDPETGLCEVYAARPMTCRVFGPPVRVDSDEAEPSYSVCELCFTEASEEEIAASAMDVPQAQEESLLERVIDTLPVDDSMRRGETIVAYCLTRS